MTGKRPALLRSDRRPGQHGIPGTRKTLKPNEKEHQIMGQLTPQEIKEDRRDDKRDDKQDRRDDKRDDKQDRRDDKRDKN
jgi:hypothetical protein